MSKAIGDVIAERIRQQSHHGYSTYHDDRHTDGAIARAATFYAMTPRRRRTNTGLWPRGWGFKSTERRRDLLKAAALLIAEIERIDRAEKGKVRA